MLAVIEKHLRALRSALSDRDVVDVLADAAVGFGFRSAYLIKYGHGFSEEGRPIPIDTVPERSDWWVEYFPSDLPPNPRSRSKAVEAGTALYLESSGFLNAFGVENVQTGLEAPDVVDATAISIREDGKIVGAVGFCGNPGLSPGEEMVLTILAYNAFAALRTADKSGFPTVGHTLTPRELEVMLLAAQGNTSVVIAKNLGMAVRTANQHIDNVAHKFGTRNRAHTVAECVRQGPL